MPWSLEFTATHLRDCVELSDEPDHPLRLRVDVTDTQLEALQAAIDAVRRQRQQTHDIAYARRQRRTL